MWYAEIINSDRLEVYHNIKFDFGLESYLQTLSSVKFRKALTRFRISAHSLAIETGRHHRKARRPTVNKFNQLIGKQSKHALHQLSKYLYFAFLKRDDNASS